MKDRMRYGWHALPRGSVLGGCAAAGILGGIAWRTLDEPPGAVMVLRGAAVLLACAVAFAVDDPAGDVLAASPTPLRRRVGLRILLAGAVAAAVWCALLLLARAAGGEPPAAALSLEALTLTVVGLAVGLGAQTWRGVDCPGILAAPAVAGAVLATFALPEKWALLTPGPGLPGWQEAHERWAAVLAVAAITAVLATRDRAARRGGLEASRGGRPRGRRNHGRAAQRPRSLRAPITAASSSMARTAGDCGAQSRMHSAR